MFIFSCDKVMRLGLFFTFVSIINLKSQPSQSPFGQGMGHNPQPPSADEIAKRKADMVTLKANQDAIIAALGSITDEESMVKQVAVIKTNLSAIYAAEGFHGEHSAPNGAGRTSSDNDDSDNKQKAQGIINNVDSQSEN